MATAIQATYIAFEPLYYGDNARIVGRGLRGEALDDDDNVLFDMLMTRALGAVLALGRTNDRTCNAFLTEVDRMFLDMPGGRSWLDQHQSGPYKAMAVEALARADRGPTS